MPNQIPTSFPKKIAVATAVLLAISSAALIWDNAQSESKQSNSSPQSIAHVSRFDARALKHAADMLKDGREIFRFDTFGDEDFWAGSSSFTRRF